MPAICFVVGLMVLSVAGPALAAAPVVPYSPGLLYVVHDGSQFWRDSAMPIPFWINLASLPSELNLDNDSVKLAIINSFATWQNDLGSYITFSYAGITTSTGNKWDNKNVVYFADIAAMATCTKNFDAITYRIIDADIAIDTRYDNGVWREWTTAGAVDGRFDLQSTVTHEAGHFLGLDDLPLGYAADKAQTMYFAQDANSIVKRSIEYGDRAGLRYLYGGYKTAAEDMGSSQAGVGIDFGDIDGVTGKDMFCAWADDPSGSNYIHYKLGKNININSGSATWDSSSNTWSTSIGSYTSGVDVALWDINGDSKLDVLIAWIDNPTGQDTIKYVIGWTLSSSGIPASWSSVKSIPTTGVGYYNSGLGVKIAKVTGDASRPDLILGWVDNPTGNDYVRYKVGKDMDVSGNIGSTSWTTMRSFATNIYTVEGCGICVGDFDLNGAKDIVFSIMEYHTGPDYANKVTYKVGWNLDANGVPTGWTGWSNAPVGYIGSSSDGLGLACVQLNGESSEELLFVWIDDWATTGTNDVYYRLEFDGRLTGSH